MSLSKREKEIIARLGMKPTDFEPNAEVMELKKYLADTDYVISKLSERVVLGLPTGDLLNEYQPVLQKRAEARQRINALEA